MKKTRFLCLLLILVLTVLPLASSCQDEAPPDDKPGMDQGGGNNGEHNGGEDPNPDEGGNHPPDGGEDPNPDEGGNQTPDGGEDPNPDEGGDDETGGDTLTPQLAAPTPVVNFKRQAVEWEAVPNATGYIVTVNGEARPVQTATSLSLPDGSYTVTVQAIGAQGYLDSPVSEELKVYFGWV